MGNKLERLEINGLETVVDEAKREIRVRTNPANRRRFATDGDLAEYIYWTKLLQQVVGQRVVSADMVDDEFGAGEGATPVLVFENGKTLWMLADEEGNGPGRFEVGDQK